MREVFKIKTSPAADRENIIQGEKYRITVLTEALIRLEYQEEGKFVDEPTQAVLHRDFPKASYRVLESEEMLEVITDKIHLKYNKKAFSRNGLQIHIRGGISNFHSVWYYGDEVKDLRGTARTLDEADGEIELDHGLMSKFGFAVYDDSKTLLLTEDGWIKTRENGGIDLYFFGYGRDYLGCLKDFYRLCGKTPMIPRFALGNWWSRYYKYTESSYKELMNRFEQENVPFSVAVVDMDWHKVDIDPKYGSGWTGYSWNRDFFPDPKGFMDWLHERGMRITLNVHPAEGVQGHEDQYLAMAKEMGVNYEEEDPVEFDISSQKFLEAYFKYLHHPQEEDGVDFWWLDWQQGTATKVEGLDPLWMLNHYHYLDSGREGKRPMTFSRYAGVGSHRYPVGFSGDTVVTWESLDFQPYFTANASNVGYGWWSHDIGGHMQGYKDDELEGRWVQYGVFSPIMRLHSTCCEFNGKEPWRFKPEIHYMMNDFLRLRHQLIPYLYTMNYRSYQEDQPLVQPMYYQNPFEEEAYHVRNQFWFGSEMIVAPITTKRLPKLNMAKVLVWLPEGLYVDFFTGRVYSGGRKMEMYRDINSIPVLAKAGAIVPMTEEISGKAASKNPSTLEIRVFAGADGVFSMYEDDNETKEYENGVCVFTDMKFCFEAERDGKDGGQKFVIESAKGDLSLISQKRSYQVEFCACGDCEVEVTSGGIHVPFEKVYDDKKKQLTVSVKEHAVTEELEIAFTSELKVTEPQIEESVFDFLNQAEIAFGEKETIYAVVCKGKNRLSMISELKVAAENEDLFGAVAEILTSYCEA